MSKAREIAELGDVVTVNAGNVGIGTASPSAPIQVVSTTGSIPALGAASSHAAIGSSGFGTMIGTQNTGAGYIQQQRFDGAATAYNLLLQPNGGNVGIGNAAPATALDVTGTVTVGGDAAFSSQGSSITFNSGNATSSKIGAYDFSGSSPVNPRAYMEFLGVGANQATDIVFYTDDSATTVAERMRIDSSGKVGIGTSSPAYPLVVSNGGAGGIEFVPDAASGTSQILAYDRTANAYDTLRLNAASHEFNISGSNKVKITNKGSILVQTSTELAALTVASTTAVAYTANFTGQPANGYNLVLRANAGITGGTAVRIQNAAGAEVGTITYSATATAYITSSDYRLKTDAQPMTGASARVQALNPVNFEWIADGTRVDGFLAHEAATVVPESVSGTKDAMVDEEYEVTPAVLDDDGNETTAAVMGTHSVPKYQGIDQSKLVPLLTAALQEALTKIDDLETRLTALEA